MLVHAPDLMRIIESSILTFHMFVKMDNKSNGVRNLFGGGQNQNQMATPLQQVQSLLDKVKKNSIFQLVYTYIIYILTLKYICRGR